MKRAEQPAEQHRAKYEARTQAIGLDNLRPLVLWVVGDLNLTAKLAEDPNLNNIPLRLWDSWHTQVRSMALHAGQGWGLKPIGWALSDTVCVLKHVARYHMAEVSQ